MHLNRCFGLLGRLGLGAAVAAAPAVGFAGGAVALGSVSYAPMTSATVPTLSEWGLVGMALLLAVLAYRLLRNRLGGRPLASLLLAGALGLGIASGAPGLRTAYAVNITPKVSLSSASGGTAFIFNDGPTQITNNSGVPVTITELQSFLGYVFEKGEEPCNVGIPLTPNASCFVYLRLNVE